MSTTAEGSYIKDRAGRASRMQEALAEGKAAEKQWSRRESGRTYEIQLVQCASKRVPNLDPGFDNRSLDDETKAAVKKADIWKLK